MMDVTTFLGIVAGAVLVGAAIFMGGALRTFYDLPSVFITIGGTIASTLVNFPFSEIRSVLRITRIAFTEKVDDPTVVISEIIGFAEKARREGLLALENSLDYVEDDFLRRGLQLVVDATEPELIREILENDIACSEERHKAGRQIYQAMATYAPAFGMIGTLIGLIQMLRNINDPSAIGPGMATALITTFYGAMLAYLVFTPIAGKLELRSEKETLLKEIMLEGILAIQSGDNPRIVEEKLRAYLSPSMRANITYRRPVVGGYEEQA